MSSERDRREYARYDVDADVRIRPAGSTSDGLPCRLSDASRSGVALMSTQQPDSDRLQVEILNSAGELIGDPLDAEIVYVEELGQAGYRIGCRFEVPAELLPDDDDDD